jgi:hypothetical protein
VKELAGDILAVCCPSGFVHWLFGDPWVTFTWVVAGLVLRWYQRHWQKPPYRNKPEERSCTVD